jgi:type III pantothenate kinase
MTAPGSDPLIIDSHVLYLDCGNSRCKFRLGAHSGVWLEIDEALAAIDQWRPERTMIATVSAFGARLHAALQRIGRHPISLVAVRNGWHNVGLNYPEPSQFGVDRWLTLVAARPWQQSVVIVDAGTALTIDALDARGFHQGGYILPGLALMRRALVNDTFALPDVGPGQNLLPGHNTADAIANGAILALASSVTAAVRQYGLNPFRLVWTGGDAALLAEHTEPDGVIIPELVIDGMKRLYKDAAYMESLA